MAQKETPDQDLAAAIKSSAVKDRGPDKADQRIAVLVELGSILRAAGLTVKASTSWQIKVKGFKAAKDQPVHVGSCFTREW